MANMCECPRCGAFGNEALGVGCEGCLEVRVRSGGNNPTALEPQRQLAAPGLAFRLGAIVFGGGLWLTAGAVYHLLPGAMARVWGLGRLPDPPWWLSWTLGSVLNLTLLGAVVVAGVGSACVAVMAAERAWRWVRWGK